MKKVASTSKMAALEISSFSATFVNQQIQFTFDILGSYSSFVISRDLDGTPYMTSDLGTPSSPYIYDISTGVLGSISTGSNPIFTLSVYNEIPETTVTKTATVSGFYVEPLVCPQISTVDQRNNTLAVTFVSTSVTGGIAPYLFSIFMSSTETGTYTKFSNDTSGSDNLVISNTITPPNSYYLKLRVIDSSGSIAFSNSVLATTAYVISPSTIQYTGSNNIIFTWNAPGGLSSFTISLYDNTGRFVRIADFITNTTYTYDASELTPGVYRILITAANGYGSGTSDAKYPYPTLTYPNPQNGGGGGGGGGAVCFLGNAPVLTPSGYRRIDSLAVGDMVRTADGRDAAIQRVKHQRVVSPSAAVNPYVIPRGQFGATENLAISPRHAVAVPGRGMVEARELGLRQMPMKAAFDYYNLELPEWDNMVVAGVEVESLAPKKRVVMTAAEFRGLVARQFGGSVDMAKLARFVEMEADGRVAVTMSQKARRM